jgi:hypothetical protein
MKQNTFARWLQLYVKIRWLRHHGQSNGVKPLESQYNFIYDAMRSLMGGGRFY